MDDVPDPEQSNSIITRWLARKKCVRLRGIRVNRRTEGEMRGKSGKLRTGKDKRKAGLYRFINKVIVLRALKRNHPVLFLLPDQSWHLFFSFYIRGYDDRENDLFLCDTNTCKFDGECLRIGDSVTCVCQFKVRRLIFPSLIHWWEYEARIPLYNPSLGNLFPCVQRS